MEKTRCQHLTDAMVEKRKKRAAFRKKIGGEFLKHILTLGDAILPNDHTDGETARYYAKKDIKERDRPAPFATSSQQYPGQYIMAAGFSWNGPTRLDIIPKKTKITAEYFIKHVPTQMFDADVKKLYRRAAGRVVLHADSATSQTSQKAVQWLTSRKINFIPKDEWLSNSPELSPMDYFANGYLKKDVEKAQIFKWTWFHCCCEGGVEEDPPGNVPERAPGQSVFILLKRPKAKK